MVLIAPGTPVTSVAKREAGATPIVSMSNDPVISGFIKSLARPGGSITGLSLTQDTAFTGKWLERVKEMLPQVSRVGVVWNPTNRSNAATQKETGSHRARERAPELLGGPVAHLGGR